jgi:hypothetical protein
MCSLNDPFLKGFSQNKKIPNQVNEELVGRRGKNFNKGKKLIPTQEFKAPYKIFIVMLNRLYGEEKCTHFYIDWLPMARIIVKTGQVFNQVEILTFNICLNVKNVPGMKKPCFYMSTYLIDVICSSTPFPNLGWNWDMDHPHVHVYCSELWDIKYKRYFYDICDHFLSPLYTISFWFLRYRISNESRYGMKGIVDWYIVKYYTYVI